MRRIAPSLPVMMLTAHASIPTGLQAIESGARDYCLKPIELDELVEKVRIAARGTG
jgi:DNA-binding response OmpR family regulator